MTISSEVHVDSVDGVPLLWVDAPPPFTITLTFRVGQADERLPNAGITHLIEHLAFPHDHRDGVANNGTTALLSTHFYAWGEPTEAAEFLHRVTRGLHRIAVDRIDQQRSIMATEENRWMVTPRGELFIARYGARGPGVAGFRQLGLRHLNAEAVREWAARYFTRGNAILWMTGPPPARLGLDLPDGPSVPAPLATARPGPFPRWTPKPQPFVALGVTGPPTDPLGAAAAVVSRRLFSKLRGGQAVSYDVQSMGDLIDPATAHHMLVADCLEDTAPQVTDEVISAAFDFAESGPTAEEHADGMNRLERAIRDDPRMLTGWLAFAAEHVLNGMEIDEFEDDLERRRSRTRSELRDAWRAAMAEAVLCVPGWVQVNDSRFSGYDWPAAVSGRTFHAPGLARFRGGPSAVIGDNALTLHDGKGQHATVEFSDMAGLIISGAGKRLLIAGDGSELFVDAAWYSGGDELVALIDRAVPPDLWIRMG